MRNIEIEGAERVSLGTVYNYLPVNIGDRFRRIREAIRAVHHRIFPRRADAPRRQTLVVLVVERPAIESFEITGNKDIKTEDLQKSLRNVGLAAGKTFDRSVLEEVKGYLTDTYFSRGKYAVHIEEKVEDDSGNRVKIKITIKEGSRAKIRTINVVGNHAFTDKQITRDSNCRLRTAVLVQAGRSLLQRVAGGRPGETALLLHGPRLCEFPDRVHAGGHRPGKGRHLHHRQYR